MAHVTSLVAGYHFLVGCVDFEVGPVVASGLVGSAGMLARIDCEVVETGPCFDVEAFEVDFQVAEVLGMATEVGKRVALLFSVEARMLSEAGMLFAVARNPHLSAPPVSAERRNQSLRGKNFPQDNFLQLQTGKIAQL